MHCLPERDSVAGAGCAPRHGDPPRANPGPVAGASGRSAASFHRDPATHGGARTHACPVSHVGAYPGDGA
jgi:hypothetical protein